MKQHIRIALSIAMFCLGHSFVFGQLVGSFSGNLTNDSPVATHSFTTTANGDVFISIATGPELNLWDGVSLLDSDGVTSIFWSGQVSGTTVTHQVSALRAGTYNLQLVKDGRPFYFGGYTASVTLRACQVGDGAPNNNTLEAAQLLPLGNTISGHLGFRGQGLAPRTEAWFRVELPQDGSFRFTVTKSGGGEQPLRETDGDFNFDPDAQGFQLLDADGNTQMFTERPFATTSELTFTPLRAGTYYVRVILDGRTWYYWGSYTLKAEAIPTEPTGFPKASNNETPEKAWNLAPYESVGGLLSYRGQSRAPDVNAYFRVKLPKPGTLSVFLGYSSNGESKVRPSDGDLNPYYGLSLLKEDGITTMTTMNPSSPLVTRYDFTGLEAGTYLIQLKNDDRTWYYWGSYTMRWEGTGTINPSSLLKKMAFKGGELSPAFTSKKFSYSATVSPSRKAVQIRPVAAVPQAKILVAGKKVKSGSLSPLITLGPRKTVIKVVVIAPDGTRRSYAITVRRSE
jgi:uncharacterized protein (DUF2141 family)